MSISQPATRFAATHRVPPTGSLTWPEPTPAIANGPPLQPGTRVEVLEQRGDGWAHVRCDNGWEAWVDGRTLARVAQVPSPLVILGVIGVIAGCLLAWVEVPGGSMTAWEMPFEFLLGRENDLGGPKVGLLLLVVLVALLPMVTRRPLVWFAYVSLGAIAIEAVGLTLLRVRALTIGPTVGAGAVVTLLGGVLLALEGGLAARRK